MDSMGRVTLYALVLSMTAQAYVDRIILEIEAMLTDPGIGIMGHRYAFMAIVTELLSFMTSEAGVPADTNGCLAVSRRPRLLMRKDDRLVAFGA